jgi:hypothetical protein
MPVAVAAAAPVAQGDAGPQFGSSDAHLWELAQVQSEWRPTGPRVKRRSGMVWMITAGAAVVAVVVGLGIWRETFRMQGAGGSMAEWVKDGSLVLPTGVNRSGVMIKPRRQLRLANFWSQPRYGFELWRTAGGAGGGEAELVGKYLVVLESSGEWRLAAAYDVVKGKAMEVGERGEGGQGR